MRQPLQKAAEQFLIKLNMDALAEPTFALPSFHPGELNFYVVIKTSM